MTKGLQQYFPMIRTRMEVLNDIHSQPHLSDVFYSWKKEYQEEFLDFCTGVRGMKLLYDSFFKEILSPEHTPERMEEFLSLILGQTIRIRKVLPNDSSRIADETSLLILDLLVELKDGSLANIEMQKLGYKFPGQRSACYSADLLLRQYKRVRSERKKTFRYKHVKKVYTIVLFENSPAEFHNFPFDYIHRMKQESNTGLDLDLLQEYTFIPLDIFQKNRQTTGIKNDLDAWLTFLSVDEPEVIEELIRQYPRFIPMYKNLYEMCRSTERVMELYSEELRILDRNTVQEMIEDMQCELEGLRWEKRQLEEETGQLKEEKGKLEAVNGKLEAENGKLEEKNGKLEEDTGQLKERNKNLENELEHLRNELQRLKAQQISGNPAV